MGSTLTGQKIKDTYLGFIKTSDSLEVNASGKELTDGNGNDLNVFINTSGEIGFGSTPDYTIDAGSNTDAFRLPNGSTAQQPTGQTGLIRYNTTDSKLEYYDSAYKFIASENYVNTQITNLIDSAPGTLDTLNEIAASLNDDPNFYTTITGLINDKQDTITGAATTIVSSDLTVSRALISNASGKVAVSSVTDTELGYVSGVTSDIQTQINAKYDKSGGTISGSATITGNLTVDTDTLYVDSTNNRVGIGTTSPDSTIHVNAGVSNRVAKFESTDSTAYISIKDNTTSTDLQGIGTTGDQLRLYAGGAYPMVIDGSTGNVGIGTTSPSAKLDISFSGGSDSIKSASTNSTSYNGSKFYNDNSKGWHNLVYGSAYSGGSLLNIGADGAIIYGNTTSGITTLGAFDLLFGTNNSERMRIDSSGNVGIGESDPSGYWTQANQLVISEGNSGLTIKSSNIGNGRIVFTDTKSSLAGFSDGGMIHYAHTSDSMQLHTNGAERMRIDSSGRVGIGVTPSTAWSSPNFTVLQLGVGASIAGRGSAGTGDQIYISANTYYDGTTWRYIETNPASNYYQDNGEHVWRTAVNGSAGVPTTFSERMRIDSSGNVGIGTTSPNYPLTVHKTGDGIKFEVSDTVDANYRIQVSGNDIKLGSSTGSDQIFITSNTERMRITSSGNVGIGTTSPGTFLHIDSSGTPSNNVPLKVESGASTSFMHFRDANTTADFKVIVGSSGNNLLMYAGGAERMRITSGGDVLVGTTGTDPRNFSGSTYGVKIHQSQSEFAQTTMYINRSVATDGNAVVFRRNAVSVGSISVTASSTAYNTSFSDLRLKKNIEDWNENILDSFASIQPKEFHFNAQDDSEEKVKGYIAQDNVDKFPEAYPQDEDGFYSYNPSGMVVYLMKAVQELKAEIETLKSQINP